MILNIGISERRKRLETRIFCLHFGVANIFVKKFIILFNLLAERKDVDTLPPVIPMAEDEENNVNNL